jgi:hypothetical protein
MLEIKKKKFYEKDFFLLLRTIEIRKKQKIASQNS